MSVESPRTSEFLRGKSLYLLEADRFNERLGDYFRRMGMIVDSYPTDNTMMSNIVYSLKTAPPGYVLIHFITGQERIHYDRLSAPILERFTADPRILVAHANLEYALPLYHEYLNNFRQKGIHVISRKIYGEYGYEQKIQEALLQLPE